MAKTFNWKDYVDPKTADEIMKAEGLKYDLQEVENTMNGKPIKMGLLGKHRYEQTSIPLLKMLLIMKNFCFC